jgi:hypothetical protein
MNNYKTTKHGNLARPSNEKHGPNDKGKASAKADGNRTCNHPTCEGECRRERKRGRQKAIRQVSTKQAKKNKEKSKVTKEDWKVYLEIWEERAHVDFETGELILFPLSYNFHHVLPKKEGPGGYPQFRHEKWNIVLVDWNTHTKAERNIDLVPRIKTYRNELLKTKV